MKRAFFILFVVLLVLSCTACGTKNPPPEEPENSSETVEPAVPKETVPESPPENAETPVSTQPEKISVHGETVAYEQFPIPEAAAYGLTGEEARLYEAAVRQFNREACPEYFASDEELSLILPAIVLYGQYEDGQGGTVYLAGLERWFFYNLGSGLSDLAHPVYTSDCLGAGLVSFTLDVNGTLTAFDELKDGEDNTRVYKICGPLTEIAEEVLQPGGVPAEGKTRTPAEDGAEALLQPYLDFYFEN